MHILSFIRQFFDRFMVVFISHSGPPLLDTEVLTDSNFLRGVLSETVGSDYPDMWSLGHFAAQGSRAGNDSFESERDIALMAPRVQRTKYQSAI